MTESHPSLLGTDEFLDWLRSYGLDPDQVAHIELVPEGLRMLHGGSGRGVHMRVELYATDTAGERFFDRSRAGRERDKAATEVRWVPLVSLPAPPGAGADNSVVKVCVMLDGERHHVLLAAHEPLAATLPTALGLDPDALVVDDAVDLQWNGHRVADTTIAVWRRHTEIGVEVAMVVQGETVVVLMEMDRPVRSLVQKVAEMRGLGNIEASTWMLTKEVGQPLPWGATPFELNIRAGERLFLDPKPGVGG